MRNELNDLDVVDLVLWVCGNLFERKNDLSFEEAVQIATAQLPSRAKRAKDILHKNQHVVEELNFVLNNDEFTRLNEYLSNNLVSLGEDFAELFGMLQSFIIKAGLDAQKKPQIGSI